MRNLWIAALAEYAVRSRLIAEEERIYSTNLLLNVLQLDDYEEPEDKEEVRRKAEDLETILKELLDDAVSRNLIEDSVVYRDLFDTKVMNCFVPRPSEVIRNFNERYQESPQKATDYFYEISKASDYIRTYRISKDIKWKAKTTYGDLDITINLSKPEKDPKARNRPVIPSASSAWKTRDTQAESIIPQGKITGSCRFRSWVRTGDSSIRPMCILMSTAFC